MMNKISLHRILQEEIKSYSNKIDPKAYTELLENSLAQFNLNFDFNANFSQLKKKYFHDNNFYFNLKSFAQTINNSTINNEKIFKFFNNLGNYSKELIIYNDSLEFFQKCLDIQKELNENDEISIIFAKIADIYHKLAEYNQALEYYNKSLELNYSIRDLIYTRI